MGLNIADLLELRTWRTFDVDDEGRVLAGSDESGSVQLVELSPDGTATPLTALPGACQGRYLPGERAVVVVHDNGGDERDQLSLLSLDPVPSRPAGLADLTPIVHDPRYLHRLADLLPGRVVYLTNRRNNVDFDVVVRNVHTGEEQTVFEGGMVLTVAVSADSRYLAICAPGVSAVSARLVLVNTMPETEDDRVTELTDVADPDRYNHPHWTPDSSALIVSSDRGRDFSGVARYEVADRTWTWLITSEEHDLTGWLSPDGQRLLVVTHLDGTARLAVHGVTGRKLVDIDLPDDGWLTYPLPEPVWSPDSRVVGLSFSSPGTPGDVLLVDVASGQVTCPTTTADQLGRSAVIRPTPHRVPTPDGEHVPCFVYTPTVFSELAGSAVVVVHGGPASQSVRSFNPIVQALATAGHTVLVPNVRGSMGYGKRWYTADDVRRRLDSVADLAALHEWLPTLGLDPARAALWGGSYGGYMVLAGLAFQPDRWAAGVDIVGMSSLVTFLENTSAYRRANRELEYGSLAEDREFLHAASPLNRADDIRGALFVIHGANDPRVPLSEAEQIAEALRHNDVECELVVYRDEGHGLAKRTNRLDAYPRALAFLARHLRVAQA